MIKKLLFLTLIFLVNSYAQDLTQLRISGKPELAEGEIIDKSIRIRTEKYAPVL